MMIAIRTRRERGGTVMYSMSLVSYGSSESSLGVVGDEGIMNELLIYRILLDEVVVGVICSIRDEESPL
jgi:hypothetical protein